MQQCAYTHTAQDQDEDPANEAELLFGLGVAWVVTGGTGDELGLRTERETGVGWRRKLGPGEIWWGGGETERRQLLEGTHIRSTQA